MGALIAFLGGVLLNFTLKKLLLIFNQDTNLSNSAYEAKNGATIRSLLFLILFAVIVIIIGMLIFKYT